MNRRLVSRVSGSLLTLALLGCVWFFLAPQAIGGSTDYVVTAGTSMQPRFRTGDLAVVRAAARYGVGDIAAYRSHSLHTIVLHRIIGLDGDRYVFKGDNNSFRDPEHPTRSQLVGKLWFQLPAVGAKLGGVRAPRTIGALSGLAALLLVGSTAGAGRHRRRRRRREAGHATTPARGAGVAAKATPVGLGIAAVGLIVFLGLAALAFSRPSRGTATTTDAYTQHGSLSYAARAPAGAVYPAGHARTADPLFAQLVDTIHVQFDYHLESRLPVSLTGTSALRAEIASSTGWKRTLDLQPVTSFTGEHTVVRGTLHLSALEKLLRRVEGATATGGGATYTLTILPRIDIGGQLAGTRLSDSFAPQIPFTLDPLELRPQLAYNSAPSSATGGGTDPSPFTSSRSGAVKRTHPAMRTLSFHGVDLPVVRARRIATIGAAASLAALLAFALLALRRRPVDEASRIAGRYREILIPVARTDRHSYAEVVELSSFEALVRLAKRYDRMILHEQSALGHSFRVADDRLLYVYLIGNDPELLPQAAPPAAERRPEPAPEKPRAARWRRGGRHATVDERRPAL